MQKETLTLSGIAHDLNIVADFRFSVVNNRYDYILWIELLGIFAAIFTKIWIGLVILCFAIYPTICFVRECQEDKRKTAAIESIILRGDISISIKELNHISKETIYEPHGCGRRRHSTQEVTFFCFAAGTRWRVPFATRRHYEWSKEHTSAQKVLKTSLFPETSFSTFLYRAIPTLPTSILVKPLCWIAR